MSYRITGLFENLELAVALQKQTRPVTLSLCTKLRKWQGRRRDLTHTVLAVSIASNRLEIPALYLFDLASRKFCVL